VPQSQSCSPTRPEAGVLRASCTGIPLRSHCSSMAWAVVVPFASEASYVLGRAISRVTTLLRMPGHEETIGLDVAQHAERAYGGAVS